MNSSMSYGKWSSYDILEFNIYIKLLSPTDESDDIDFTEKNATAFAELLQHLDYKSLSLVIRDAQNNGRKALIILREHYLSKGKPKVISLYIELTCLRRLESMSITDSIIRTEYFWLWWCSRGYLQIFNLFQRLLLRKRKTFLNLKYV